MHFINFTQLTQRAGNFLISHKPEKSFKWNSLKGKTIIGGRPGGMPQMVLEYVLTENGLKPFEDVTLLTNIQFSATAGAFISGQADYTVEFEPTASLLESEDQGYVVDSLGTACGKIPYTTYMATKNYIKEYPEVIEKFTLAIARAQEWTSTHTAKEIAEVISPYFKDVDLDLLTQIVKRYRSQDTWKESPHLAEDQFDRLKDILEQGNQLKTDFNFQELINHDFTNSLQK